MTVDESRRAVVIARQYYLQGLSKVEIAKLHDLSRFKVARILEESLQTGLVRIEIAGTVTNDDDLSERLRQRYELHHAVVVSGAREDGGELRAVLGEAAATLLRSLVTAEDVLGVAWGRTLTSMVDKVRDLPPCDIVQLTGIAGPAQSNAIDLVRQLLSVSRGAHYPLYAPLLVSDAQTASGLAKQASIAATMAQWKRVSLAMVAVGSWNREGSQLYPTLEREDREAIGRHQIAAELCSILFDANGRLIKTPLAKRSMAISYPELMSVPEVVAVAGGLNKVGALHSVLCGRAVTSLVTDAAAARELLTLEPRLLPPTSRRRRP